MSYLKRKLYFCWLHPSQSRWPLCIIVWLYIVNIFVILLLVGVAWIKLDTSRFLGNLKPMEEVLMVDKAWDLVWVHNDAKNDLQA